MEQILPVFTTHHSIGESILTVEKEDKIKPTQPVSVLAIAKTHGEPQIVVAESDISSYWKLYKYSKALDVQLIYGIKIAVCADRTNKEEASAKSESNVIIFFKNSQAYYDFVPIYSDASTIGDRDGLRRLDWKTLNERWTENFELALPFYSSFIARNLMVLDSCCFPDFGSIEPTFLLAAQGLPFDAMITRAVKKYADLNKVVIQPAHQIYYYKDKDVTKHLAFKCIKSDKFVSNLEKPNIQHYGSNKFSYESYRKLSGNPI